MDDRQKAISLYIDLMKKVLTASIYEESSWVVRNYHAKRFFNKLLFKLLQRKSLLFVKTKSFDKSQRDEGKDWPLFSYTMIGHRRLENVQMCVEEILRNEVPGDLIETGAWRGGTTIFMRALLKAHGVMDRKIWVADSFEGMPIPKDKNDGWNLSRIDYLKVSLDEVKSNFERFDLLDEQVEFIKGWFCDSLPNAPINKLALLRLDGDIYSSTMDSLQNLYHKVSQGGYVIVDDYHSWSSCRRAITDFLEKNSIKPEIKTVDWSGAYWKV